MARTRLDRDTAVFEPEIAGNKSIVEDAAPPPPPPVGVDALDLVLDRDELEMLKVFDKSFKLPGLKHGLLKPVCSEDYYPEDDDFESAETYRERTPAEQLQALMKQTESLRVQADEVLEEEPLEEELGGEDAGPPVFDTATRPSSGAHVRTVRRPGSAARPPSQGARPGPSQGQGSRPPRPSRW